MMTLSTSEVSTARRPLILVNTLPYLMLDKYYHTSLLQLTCDYTCAHVRFFCDCGAGALSCDCLLTGLKAHSCSNPRAGSNNHQLGGAGPHASPSSNELSNSVPSWHQHVIIILLYYYCTIDSNAINHHYI